MFKPIIICSLLSRVIALCSPELQFEADPCYFDSTTLSTRGTIVVDKSAVIG